MARRPRAWRLLVGIAVIAVLLAVALWPEPLPVDVVVAVRGPLVVTVDDEGETRVHDRYVVSAPVMGRIERIDVEPGDAVRAGQRLTRVRPESPPLLDARTRAEIQAAVESATAALGRARSEERRAGDALVQARREMARTRDLAQSGLATLQEQDARGAEVLQSEASAAAATFAVEAAASELRRAQARLAAPSGAADGRPVAVTAPVAGVVLKRLRESEALVPAGEPLIEIGDPSRLEIVVDLLSADAVQVRPKARALVEQWGGSRTLEARVRRVEPAGFTKISALGVEEQRVNVLLDPAAPGPAWIALGDAYRVEVRIVLWESADVLKIPTSALFRAGSDWAVYVVVDGRARLTRVTIDHRTGQEAEVISGVEAGATLVVFPPDTLVDSGRVAPRSAS